jgi:hypothetical protein
MRSRDRRAGRRGAAVATLRDLVAASIDDARAAAAIRSAVVVNVVSIGLSDCGFLVW